MAAAGRPVCCCGLAIRRGTCQRATGASVLPRHPLRPFTSSAVNRKPIVAPERQQSLLDTWSKYREVAKLPLENGQNGQYFGFIGKRRNVGKLLSFADLTLPSGKVIQLCSKAESDAEAHAKFRQIPAHSPVIIQADPNATPEHGEGKATVNLKDIRTLNSFPKDVIVTPETVFPQTKRHLQLRFHPELQARLRFRSWLKAVLNQGLLDRGFTDVETPTLFKSTPEGAREFLVPTRQRGTAYALTQSPQQYKQVLVASGIGRYMQWARCYRDEDSRADRQPEFSQLDMEWAFAGAANVQEDVTSIILRALSMLRPSQSYQSLRDGERIPLVAELGEGHPDEGPPAHQFTNLTFAEAIAKYGSDKPDLRIPGQISEVPIPETARHFVSMISHLPDPMVEAFAFSLPDGSPETSRRFVKDFMDNMPKQFVDNEDGMPQTLIFDSSKPLCGFSSIGFEWESIVEAACGGQELNDGDIVVFQARPRHEGQYTASSTKIGEFRSLLWKALVEDGQMERPRLGEAGSLQFAWVTEFPMFKPVEEDEPWKAEDAGAGIAACHHPFTAPLSGEDLELLFTDPLQAKSAAYDLVLNGVEVGGGSERNHLADIQEFIMRDVLRMPDQRIAGFSHLFEALRSGCPPHAGFALGFDRLVALMTDTSTVRDVMAFPKTMKGDDPFVRSPSVISNGQLEPYGLMLRPGSASS